MQFLNTSVLYRVLKFVISLARNPNHLGKSRDKLFQLSLLKSYPSSNVNYTVLNLSKFYLFSSVIIDYEL